MFHTQTDNVFGICQLGEWDTFNHSNVESYNKRSIDFSKPFPLWLPVLQELSNLFIVSKFTAPEDITNALGLIRLCRNHLVFITVLTPSINKTRKDLVEIVILTKTDKIPKKDVGPILTHSCRAHRLYKTANWLAQSPTCW